MKNTRIHLFKQMIGVVFDSVWATSHEMKFECEDGRHVLFHHEQDCCESVYIEDVCGDLKDLENSPIVIAEQVESNPNKEKELSEPGDCSETWTFYRFGTAKGTVTVRWLGTSNGYYSESVSVEFNNKWDDEYLRFRNNKGIINP